jgi:hypothetical protein
MHKLYNYGIEYCNYTFLLINYIIQSISYIVTSLRTEKNGVIIKIHMVYVIKERIFLISLLII